MRIFSRRPLFGAAGVVAGALALTMGWVMLTPQGSGQQGEPVADAVPAVAISAITSDVGSLTAGERVTLAGENLSKVTAVMFDNSKASDLVHVDENTITVTVPTIHDYVPSTVTVAVKTDCHTAAITPPLAYTYEAKTNVDRQMQYLFTYWDNYNSDQYGDLNDVGGDCANFVSQSLLARGWTMTDDWYSYDSGTDWSAAWGYVPAFDEWLRAHPEYGATEHPLNDRSQVKIGDLVVFDWDNDGSLDHIQVVSSVEVVDGVTKIGMVGHNTDSDYRDLDQTITVDHPGATGYFWSIPAS